jgi:hypothetical protein
MLFLWLLQIAWPTPEVGVGFAVGLTFALMNFREARPAPKRDKA